MIQIALTPEQFAAKVAQLKQEEGIELTGDSGKVSKDGVTAVYDYDGAKLTVNVVSRPMLVTKSYCEGRLKAWLGVSS